MIAFVDPPIAKHRGHRVPGTPPASGSSTAACRPTPCPRSDRPVCAGHHRMPRIGRGDRRRPRQRHAQRLGGGGHRGGGAHGHAVPRRPGRSPSSTPVQVLLRDPSRPAGPPSTSTCPIRIPTWSPAQLPRSIGPAGMNRHGRSIDEAPISRPRCGLVAAPHQHCTVDRIGAQQLLGLHGQQIPVQHGGGLLEWLRQRHRGKFDGEPTSRTTRRVSRPPHAAGNVCGTD